MIVDHEWIVRENRKPARRLRAATLRQAAP